MNPCEVVRRLKMARPYEASDLEGVLCVKEMDSGCFRTAYHVTGTRIVIKFPMESCGRSHSRREIRRIREILNRVSLRHMRRYVPKIYYADYQNGVLALELLGSVGHVSNAECIMLEHLAADTFYRSPSNTDLSYTNIGRNSRGQIKILDLGSI
jgi:hypothetical protein